MLASTAVLSLVSCGGDSWEDPSKTITDFDISSTLQLLFSQEDMDGAVAVRLEFYVSEFIDSNSSSGIWVNICSDTNWSNKTYPFLDSNGMGFGTSNAIYPEGKMVFWLAESMAGGVYPAGWRLNSGTWPVGDYTLALSTYSGGLYLAGASAGSDNSAEISFTKATVYWRSEYAQSALEADGLDGLL